MSAGAWLRWLAMHDHLFVLESGIKVARLSFMAVWQGRLLTQTIQTSVLINQPFELCFQGQLHLGTYSSKYQYLTNRKLSPKCGVGRYAVMGPLSQGYSIWTPMHVINYSRDSYHPSITDLSLVDVCMKSQGQSPYPRQPKL